jgi:hypothetical protein
MESFSEVRQGNSVVVDNLSNSPDDADVVVGVGGKAPAALGRRKDTLFAPAVDGVSGDVELATELVDGVHGVKTYGLQGAKRLLIRGIL